MWESPIKITENIKRQMDMEIENGIMTAVREIGIVVNKEELLKALQYDRGQYEKGYQDGVTDTNVGGKWIPCSERLPENETEVEISCIRKYIGAGDKKKVAYFTARAFYTDGTMTTEDSSYVWEDCDNWEYDEEKDAYIIPEGWWECVTFSDEFGVVDAEVIAWCPLPEPYKGE